MPAAIAMMFFTLPHNWIPIISEDTLSFNVSLDKFSLTKLTVFLLYPAIAKAAGSLFTKSIANVGPDITQTLFVFNFFLTTFERVLNVTCSIPLDAIQIGTFYKKILYYHKH